MFYFLMQLAAVLASAMALGLLVGWMLWARALRHHRRGHAEQVNVLHKQLASLADENRRVQQRFASTAADLDSQRLVMQTRDVELRRAREAFTISQQNLAGAEDQFAAAQAQLSEEQQHQQSSAADLSAAKAELTALHTEISSLRLDNAEAKAAAQNEAETLHQRVEELAANAASLDQRAVLAETDADALRHDVATANSELSQLQSRSTYLGRALDAAVARANERGDAVRSQRAAHAERAASAQQLQLQQVVADAHESKRSDVRALTTTWEQISNKRAQQQRAHQAEIAQLRARVVAAESSLAASRLDAADRLQTVQQQTFATSSADARQRESAAMVRLTEEHSGVLSAVAARHDRQVSEQLEAHQVAIAHWREDMTQRAAARDVDLAAIAHLEAEVRASTSRLAAVQTDLAAVQTELAAVQTELDRVALERHLLEEASQRQHAEHQVSQAQLAAAQEQLGATQGEYAAAQQRFAGVETESSQAQQRLAAVEAESAATKGALKELGFQFDAAVISLGSLRREGQESQRCDAAALTESKRAAEVLRLRLELAETEAHRLHLAQIQRNESATFDAARIAESQRMTLAAATQDAMAWKRELEALQAIHRRDLARLRDLQSISGDFRFAMPEARRLRTGQVNNGARPLADVIDLSERPTAATATTITTTAAAATAATVATAATAEDPPGSLNTASNSAVGQAAAPAVTYGVTHVDADDLQVIEGIGPKIAAALRGAGIATFVRLEAASPDQLRDALASSGLTFAPSLPTWSKQAGFMVREDVAGLATYQADLTAGREAR